MTLARFKPSWTQLFVIDWFPALATVTIHNHGCRSHDCSPKMYSNVFAVHV